LLGLWSLVICAFVVVFFFFFLTDTFRLSRLGSDLRSCSSRFLFSQIYVDTPEIL
jgi:hypothetical protein